jgi:hypothetical protein
VVELIEEGCGDDDGDDDVSDEEEEVGLSRPLLL